MSDDAVSAHGAVEKCGSWAGWLLLAGALFLMIQLLFPAVSDGEDPKRSIARSDAGQLVTALKRYHIEYGVAPGGGGAQILVALGGDNPRKVVFFVWKPDRLSPRGELLDPWKTPYRIDTSDAAFPKVYSFGKDKQDNGGELGSDDVASWR